MPSILAAVAASAAVHITSLPWKGPVGVVNLGFKEGKYIVNPTNTEMAESDLDLVVSSTKEAVLMIETGAKEVSEEVIVDGVKMAFDEAQNINKAIEEFATELRSSSAMKIKRDTYEEEKPSEKLEKQIHKLVDKDIPELVKNMATHEGASDVFKEMVASVAEQVEDENDKKWVAEIIDHIKKDYIREQILKKGIRPDGRKLTEIRPLASEVSFLPRTHGSGLFTRGQTQVLSIATLGSTQMGQLLETAEGEQEKRYMHHYSMPPFTTGEVGRVGNPGRREIGHGALAEKALMPVLPDVSVFPYAIRVVSEVMSSNGSTSMASVCGSSLALMDAGVPITAPVSGIAMGLIIDGKDVAILSDIMGIEDFNGDMDFKVAGTTKGITAIQLDVKTLNLTPAILEKALAQSKIGRAEMLKVVTDAISEPRAEVSAYAPKITLVKIPVDKIGELIGPGGKAIKALMADTGTQIDVEDDGSVAISGIDKEGIKSAIEYIEGMGKEVMAGEIYDGEVVRMMSFGAFVNILPGKDGMVHVSDMGQEGFVADANDVLHVGDKVKVRVKKIDDQGRVNLSMNMDPAMDEKIESSKRERTGGDRGGSRGGSRGGGFNRGGNDRGHSGGGRPGGFSRGPRTGGFNRDTRGNADRPATDGRSSGPHFPTSRYFQTGTNVDR